MCGRIKALFRTLIEIFKQSPLNTLDYYAIAIFTLFIFWGYRDYFSPAGLFGMHDFINGRKCKGILYIIVGNACLLLKNYVYDLGNLACTVYLFVALIDLLVQSLKRRKAKNQKNNLIKGDSHGI